MDNSIEKEIHNFIFKIKNKNYVNYQHNYCVKFKKSFYKNMSNQL